MSSEKVVATVHPGTGSVPLTAWDPFMIKVYNKPDGSLGSDYYLIQREMAKRGKRGAAVRYMLKVVAIVTQESNFLAASSSGGLTTAIGAISTDHFHNTEIRGRMDSVGESDDAGPLELRAVASAFGEGREELRVRPEEITGLRVLPTTVVYPDSKSPNRFTVHVFVVMELDPSVRLADLESRRLQDMADKGLPDSFRETGGLRFIRDWQYFGQRTMDLLDSL